MSILNSNQRQQRLNSRNKWPRWLRNSYLLKIVIFIGVLIYRVWRLWRSLTDWSDG